MACILTSKLLKSVLTDILRMVLQRMKKVYENKQIPSNDMAPNQKLWSSSSLSNYTAQIF